MLGHASVQRLFGLSSVQIYTFLSAFDSIIHFTVFVVVFFRVKQSPSECIASFNINRDIKNPDVPRMYGMI